MKVRRLISPTGITISTRLVRETEPALAVELLQSFLEILPKQRKQLLEAVESGNLKQIELSAHSLKGGSMNFGAKDLSQVAARIEALAEQSRLDDIRASVKEFEAVLDRSMQELTSVLENVQKGTL